MRGGRRSSAGTFARNLNKVQQQAAAAGIIESNDDDDDDDDEDDDDAETGNEEVTATGAETPAAVVQPFRPLRNGVPGGVAPPGASEETGAVKVINEWIDKLRNDDQAYVTAWRIKPEYINGAEASGMSGRWSISGLRNADDLLADIEQKSGGTVYDIRFNGVKTGPRGSVLGQMKQVRVSINATPLLRAGAGKDRGGDGNAAPSSPDADLTKGTFEVLKSTIQDLKTDMRDRNDGGKTQVEMVKLLQGIQANQTDFFRKELENARAAGNGAPSAEAIAAVQRDAQREIAREREQWNAERQRMADQLERERALWTAERSKLLSDHEKERQQLGDKLTAQLERTTEKLEAAQDKLKDRESEFSRERADRERAFDERMKHRDEMHARDTQSLRDQWQNEVKRLTDQVSDERRAAERLKDMYDLAKKSELDKQEGIFREQLQGAKNRNEMLETRIHDLEKGREALQSELIAARTAPTKDPLATVRETLGAVGSIAGAIGWKPDGGASSAPVETRTEIGQLAKDMRDAGVLDAAKGIADKLATAIGQRQPAAQQQQQFVPMQQFMPPGAFPLPPQSFMPQPYNPAPVFVPPPPVHQQFVPQPVQMPQQQHVHQHVQQPQPPQPQPAPQPAQPQPQPQAEDTSATAAAAPEPEPEMSEMEVIAWKEVIKNLEAAVDASTPAEEVAAQLRREIPEPLIREIVAQGLHTFQTGVQRILKRHRPEESDTVLLSPRGEAWLRDLIFALQESLRTA